MRQRKPKKIQGNQGKSAEKTVEAQATQSNNKVMKKLRSPRR